MRMIELLKNLDAAVTFRPEEGPLRVALAAKALADADAERVELFSAENCDIKVTVTRHTQEEGFLRFLVVSDLGEQSLQCELAGLNDLERADLREQLSHHASEHRPAVAGGAKVIVRKASTSGMYTHQQASDRLSFSREFLKSRIPCSDYSYDEIDGKKVLREFYWAQSLIDRLQKIKQAGAKPDDVKYVAAECCFGDTAWAEELLASLRPKADNPVNPGTKKHPPKHHFRGGSHPGQERKK